ncbi:MAG TPA: hypothetical protein VHW00_13375 [Thermoanaerobaculia bacterium]|nr:hypothetical protein [Thermoanaerobaculia bacterium]
MANTAFYYQLSLGAEGTTSSHYVSIQPDPSISLMQGGFAFAVTAAQAASVTIYPQVAQLQIPPSNVINGSVTIVTEELNIAGSLHVSPAAEVPFTLTCWGAGGKQLGTATVEVGGTVAYFAFSVLPGDGMTKAQASAAIKQHCL